jgi:putative membrane protein
MKLIFRWLLASVALLITVSLVPGLDLVGGAPWALGAVLVLGLLNLLARPAVFLFKALTFPLSCLSFGLWTFLISLFVNILIFYFVGSLRWGFAVDTFGAAAVGALVMSVLNTVLTGLFELGRRGADR